MLSKILTGGFILIMVGAVIAGAIAVFSPTEEAHTSAQARGQSERLGQNAQAESLLQGQGRGQGQGQGQGSGRQATSEFEAIPLELETVEGVVVETDELMIETAGGETVQVGLGPSTYREAQGFVLKLGENVSASGYWEDDEFKATTLENQTTGQSIVLRDATGRPMWAGQGRGKNRSS
jgi:hypothetical protein